MHPVVHVSKLRKFYTSEQFKLRQDLLPILEIIEDEFEYVVKDILRHRLARRSSNRREYLVCWEGYKRAHDSWDLD